MSRRLPPLNALRAFEAAARLLSFTRAAEELFVTQAAVSHQIKALEAYLGVKLFYRRNRCLLLTEAGQRYFLDIKDIFTGIHDATERLLAVSAKGSLTVCLQPSFAIQWLVPRLALFNAEHPDIDVRIKAVDLNEGSLVDDVDVAIYYGQGHWPGLSAVQLHNEYLIPVCAPSLLQGAKPLTKLSDLAAHTLLHDGSRADWQAWYKQTGLVAANVHQGSIFSHSSMVLQAAIHGQGVALGHSVLAEPELAAGRLVCPFEQVLLSNKAYYVVCQASEAGLTKIAAFRDWMLALVEKEQQIKAGLISESALGS